MSEHSKDRTRLLTFSYAVSAGPSELEGDGIFFLSLISNMALRKHEKVPIVCM